MSEKLDYSNSDYHSSKSSKGGWADDDEEPYDETAFTKIQNGKQQPQEPENDKAEQEADPEEEEDEIEAREPDDKDRLFDFVWEFKKTQKQWEA